MGRHEVVGSHEVVVGSHKVAVSSRFNFFAKLASIQAVLTLADTNARKVAQTDETQVNFRFIY